MPKSIPREAQEKMINYNFVLSGRYTPAIDYFKLSAGYTRSGDAASDTTPVSAIYTGDNKSPGTSSIISINQNKSINYNGGDLWYHVFDSASVDLQFIILIGTEGIVKNKITIP